MSQDNFKQLHTWAEAVKNEFSAGYDLEGIQKIEAAIVSNRKGFTSLPESEQYYRASSFGAFIGHCLIQNFKGEWYETGGSIGVRLPDENIWVNPFHQVWKHAQQEGLPDSITSFYKITGNFQSLILAEE